MKDLDWHIAKKYLEFLKVFYDSTLILFGVYYPTSPLAIHQVYEMTDLFYTYRDDDFFGETVKKMEKKILKYWSEIPFLYALGLILDPRAKMMGFERILYAMGCQMRIDFSNQISNVRNKLFEVYSMYENRYRELRTHAVAQIENRPRKKSWSLINSVNAASNVNSMPFIESQETSQYTELKLYLDTDFTLFEQSQRDEFDILLWWKSHANTFPILSMLARDVLTIPISTIFSEQAFSTAGRIIEEGRTCLTPEMVEVLTCVKDWEHADL